MADDNRRTGDGLAKLFVFYKYSQVCDLRRRLVVRRLIGTVLLIGLVMLFGIVLVFGFGFGRVLAFAILFLLLLLFCSAPIVAGKYRPFVFGVLFLVGVFR